MSDAIPIRRFTEMPYSEPLAWSDLCFIRVNLWRMLRVTMIASPLALMAETPTGAIMLPFAFLLLALQRLCVLPGRNPLEAGQE